MSNKKNKGAAEQHAAPTNTPEEILGSSISEPAQSEETTANAEVIATPVNDSVKIGKEKVELEFLQFTHPDGRKLRFKQASHGKILTAKFGEVTPAKLCEAENKDKLIEFVKDHPIYFTEVFE